MTDWLLDRSVWRRFKHTGNSQPSTLYVYKSLLHFLPLPTLTLLYPWIKGRTSFWFQPSGRSEVMS